MNEELLAGLLGRHLVTVRNDAIPSNITISSGREDSCNPYSFRAMADEDDLGDFFNEINQIEEIPAVEQTIPIVVNENTVLSHSTTKSVAAVVNVIDSKSSSSASVMTKETGHQNPMNSELVAVNHAVYTYAAVPSNPENVATDGQFVAGGSAPSHADSFASSSSSMRKTSIGPSIGPSAPPGPRPPSNSFPHSSSSSGGLNLSLHSFSTSYVTSTGTSSHGHITVIEINCYAISNTVSCST